MTCCGVGKGPPRLRRRPATGFKADTDVCGYEIVEEFYDAAVSGADPIETRAAFAAMLERLKGNGVRTIIVETANRFARDLMVQEVGHARLRERGIDLTIAPMPSLTTRPPPSWYAKCWARSPSSTRR